MRGQVWLVGAGCGGRELLTLAALDCIRRQGASLSASGPAGSVSSTAGFSWTSS